MDRVPGGPQSMGLKRVEHNSAHKGWDLPIFITPKLGSTFSYMPAHQFSSVTKSCLTLWPHGLKHARLPCSSPTPGACSNSCPSSWWCHLSISSSAVPFSSRLQSVHIRVFSNESVLCIRWPKYWSFSFSLSPSKECSGLVSFRIDWFDLLTVQGTLNSLLQYHSSKASTLQRSALFKV